MQWQYQDPGRYPNPGLVIQNPFNRAGHVLELLAGVQLPAPIVAGADLPGHPSIAAPVIPEAPAVTPVKDPTAGPFPLNKVPAALKQTLVGGQRLPRVYSGPRGETLPTRTHPLVPVPLLRGRESDVGGGGVGGYLGDEAVREVLDGGVGGGERG